MVREIPSQRKYDGGIQILREHVNTYSVSAEEQQVPFVPVLVRSVSKVCITSRVLQRSVRVHRCHHTTQCTGATQSTNFCGGVHPMPHHGVESARYARNVAPLWLLAATRCLQAQFPFCLLSSLFYSTPA